MKQNNKEENIMRKLFVLLSLLLVGGVTACNNTTDNNSGIYIYNIDKLERNGKQQYSFLLGVEYYPIQIPEYYEIEIEGFTYDVDYNVLIMTDDGDFDYVVEESEKDYYINYLVSNKTERSMDGHKVLFNGQTIGVLNAD